MNRLASAALCRFDSTSLHQTPTCPAPLLCSICIQLYAHVMLSVAALSLWQSPSILSRLTCCCCRLSSRR
jgi:hypothetical protein